MDWCRRSDRERFPRRIVSYAGIVVTDSGAKCIRAMRRNDGPISTLAQDAFRRDLHRSCVFNDTMSSGVAPLCFLVSRPRGPQVKRIAANVEIVPDPTVVFFDVS